MSCIVRRAVAKTDVKDGGRRFEFEKEETRFQVESRTTIEWYFGVEGQTRLVGSDMRSVTFSRPKLPSRTLYV